MNVRIRAGWISYIRLHGVSPHDGQAVALSAALQGPVELLCDDFRIVLEEQLSIPVNYPTANLLAVEGGPNPKPRNVTRVREEDPPGFWLEVVLSRDYEVDATVAKPFLDSQGTDPSAVDSLLSSKIEAELSEAGLLMSAAAIVSFERSQPHLRAVGRVYWWSSERYTQRITQKVTLTIVPQLIGKRDQLVAMSATIAPLLIKSADSVNRERRPLVLAAHWLLVVSDLPIHSNERFVLYFQVLEALTRRVDSSPDQALSDGFAKLEQLCAKATSSDRPTLDALVQRAKERTLAPSLRERFGRLARKFNPNGAADDVAAFDAMADLRNDLIHARITQVPAQFRDRDVEQTLRRMSFFYFEHLIRDFTSAHSVAHS